MDETLEEFRRRERPVGLGPIIALHVDILSAQVSTITIPLPSVRVCLQVPFNCVGCSGGLLLGSEEFIKLRGNLQLFLHCSDGFLVLEVRVPVGVGLSKGLVLRVLLHLLLNEGVHPSFKQLGYV